MSGCKSWPKYTEKTLKNAITRDMITIQTRLSFLENMQKNHEINENLSENYNYIASIDKKT